MTPRFAVYSSSMGNYFFDEIRDLFACGLMDLGFDAAAADEQRGFLESADWHIVVAPHEFFMIGAGIRLRRGKFPRNLILLNTEQPGSPWFDLALSLFARAWAVWDMDRDTSNLIRSKGFPGRHVPLGYSSRSPLFSAARLPRGEGSQYLEQAARRRRGSWELKSRPLDVLFEGGMTERRHDFFTRNLRAMSRWRAALRFSDPRAPLRPEDSSVSATRVSLGLAQRSKIVLNLHRRQARYFEWHRIALHGIGQRALVLTEPVSPAPPLKPGRDFIEAPLTDFPRLLNRLLGTISGRRQAQTVAEQGFETFSRRCRMKDFLIPVVEELMKGTARGKAAPLKDLAVSLPPLEAPPTAEIRRLAGTSHAGKVPLVTVAVSLHDYKRFIIPCLESIRSQTLRSLDLIVVDDASTDGSEKAVLRWLKRRGRRFARWRLLRHDRNAGLARTRNTAFADSRTPYVFVMDADNLLLPRCLERLSSALGGCRADFAFSYFHAFGEEDYLMNLKPWDPELLRRKPYLDAMALVRRSTWKRLGGYRRQMVQGWEDYDFWLRLARVGGRGVQVPEVLARYRVHMRSMLNTETAPDEHRLRRYFLREHQITLDADNVSQLGLASGVFGGKALPVRVESAERNGSETRRGKYLVAALTVLRDLNKDVLAASRR